MASEEEARHPVDVESVEIAVRLRSKAIESLSCADLERLFDDNFHANDQVWVALRQLWDSTQQADLPWESSELQSLVGEFAELERARAEAETNLLVSKLEVQTACASAGGLKVSKLAGVLEEAVRFRWRCRQLGQFCEQVMRAAHECLEQADEQHEGHPRTSGAGAGRVSVVPGDAVFCLPAPDDMDASGGEEKHRGEEPSQVQEEAAALGDPQDGPEAVAQHEQGGGPRRASCPAASHRIAVGVDCAQQLATAEQGAAARAVGGNAPLPLVGGGLSQGPSGCLGPGINDSGRRGPREAGSAGRSRVSSFGDMEYVELDSDGEDVLAVRRNVGSTQQFCKVLVDLFRVYGVSQRGSGT